MSPSLGRFLSADSVQPNAPGTQGYDAYAYVANNPTTWVDPSGNQAELAMSWQGMDYARAMTAAVMAYRELLPSLEFDVTAAVREAPNAVTGFVTANALNIVFAAVTAPVIVCALTPGCPQAALEMAQEMGRLGANTWEGVREWTAEKLWRAVDDFPWQEEAGDGAKATDKGGETDSPKMPPPIPPCKLMPPGNAVYKILATIVSEELGRPVTTGEISKAFHQIKKGVSPASDTGIDSCTGDVWFGGEVLGNILDWFGVGLK